VTLTKTVLTIDDSKSVRDMVAFALQPEGYTVVQAEDGSKGLDQLRSVSPQLVITDLNMPVMDGISFIEAARKDPKGTGVPIIMLTTETSPDMKARGKAAGATGWIDKPFDPAKLVAVAKKLLG
jgi:two-component system chemotaxis response regulator CheY